MTLDVQRLLTVAGGKHERQSLCGRMNAYHVPLWLVLGFWTRHNHIRLEATFEEQQSQRRIIGSELINQWIQANIGYYVAAYDQKVWFNSKMETARCNGDTNIYWTPLLVVDITQTIRSSEVTVAGYCGIVYFHFERCMFQCQLNLQLVLLQHDDNNLCKQILC